MGLLQKIGLNWFATRLALLAAGGFGCLETCVATVFVGLKLALHLP